ncbi:MAG TPA: hypothetical protein VLA92_04440 [Candidatus Saccharimonadales bacterium]|nr:hypothetical protein [Candidatus Saccharimonadales bacterium]
MAGAKEPIPNFEQQGDEVEIECQVTKIRALLDEDEQNEDSD